MKKHLATIDMKEYTYTEKKDTRSGFGDGLTELGQKNKNVVALCADLTGSLKMNEFKNNHPNRFFQVGIAEANMIGLAAGMARGGDIPFVHSFSVFLTRRAYDQIAMQIAYPQLNVKLAGFLPGLTTLLGVSHQAIDDLALMRVLPNLTIIEPSSGKQTAAAVRAAAKIEGPVYLRLHKDKTVISNAEVEQNLEVGKGQLLLDGDDAIIFASGYMVAEALVAADFLSKSGIKVSVANMHTLKPFDSNFVLQHATRTGVVVTAENHSVIGGLGDAIASFLNENKVQYFHSKVGLNDIFSEGASTDYLMKKYQMNFESIYKTSIDLIK